MDAGRGGEAPNVMATVLSKETGAVSPVDGAIKVLSGNLAFIKLTC